jgi:taurine dioxygenase
MQLCCIRSSSPATAARLDSPTPLAPTWTCLPTSESAWTDCRPWHSIRQLGILQAAAADGQSSTATGTLADLPEVLHPLAPPHPTTGARTLLLGTMVVTRIDSLAQQEGRQLLDSLPAHTTSASYVHTHRWEQDDLVVWDNRALLHTASPCDSSRHHRLLLRAAVR